jgi:hypothetical protein
MIMRQIYRFLFELGTYEEPIYVLKNRNIYLNGMSL